MFTLEDVWFRYHGAAEPTLRAVELRFATGVHTAVVGPNGAGKSTLLRVMLGRLNPERGRAWFDGRPAAEWPRRRLARRVAVVGQEALPDFPISVREYVELGRHPYLPAWAPLRERDREVVEGALRRTELDDLSDRDVSHLSAGELQRAKIARALAQEPEVLVLDEPTAHLDLGHEMQVFELIRELIVEKRLTAVSVTHNLNLAGRFATSIVLLAGGRVAAVGSAETVLVPELIQAAFGWPVTVTAVRGGGRQVVPR
jgi:iron complex transport system ATP-binding protein